MRALITIAVLAMLAACASSEPPPTSAPLQRSQAPAPPAPAATAAPSTAAYQWFRGEATAVSATSVTVRAADGASTTIALAPDWMLVIGRVIQASDIKVGDFVATANTITADNAGRSVELRVFPAGVRLGEGSRPMADGNNMTNGTVGEVVDTTDGRVMVVRYPGGERHITLPRDVSVVGQRVGEQSDLQQGWNVRVLARADANGVLTSSYIYTGENGAPAPGR